MCGSGLKTLQGIQMVMLNQVDLSPTLLKLLSSLVSCSAAVKKLRVCQTGIYSLLSQELTL